MKLPDTPAFAGRDLQRPECVLCTRRGDLFVSDRRGGVMRIHPDGRQTLILPDLPADVPPLWPNGIALLPDGSWLVADLSEAHAGVWRLHASGRLEPFLRAVDGVPLPSANFVMTDRQDRVWITVSSRMAPRTLDFQPDAASGFVVLVDPRGARIVADGLGFTNECRLDADERWLYVNETFGRRITRFRVAPDGTLAEREVFATFGAGTFPDGLALDIEGGLWLTSIVSNRLIRIAPDGAQEIVLEDADAGHIARAEAAYHARTMDRAHLDTVESHVLRNISSVAFGGPDLRTMYLGSLLGDRVVAIRSPVAGLPLAHWDIAPAG
ncbi:MAG: SMP-30/gluconolactonase/LRE family protein [Rhodothermales bacterium]